MIDHRAAEILLATAVDFPLAPDEQATLDAHLAGCDRCRAIGAQLRREALLLREMAAEHASPSVRMAVEAAVLQSRPQTSRFLLLLAAALLMALAVGGTVVLGGGWLDLDGLSVNPSQSFPGPIASETPQATTGGTPTPAPVGVPPDTLILYGDTRTHPATGMYQIHTIRADGTGDRTLADGLQPAWSPDGRLIAYECDITPSGDPPGSICVMAADGTNNRTLVQGSSPQWSPDGLSIAYSCGIGTADALADICTMDADGSRAAVLVSEAFAPFSSLGSQFWSPDGSHVLFSRSPFDFGDSWVANADGTEITRVGEGRGTWSPDGSWIMLESGVEGPQPDVSVVRPDGSDFRPLGNTNAPIWSPDSRRIAFIAVSGALQAFDVESGALETLDESAWNIPAWIADQLIAAVGGDDGGLYLINLETDDVRPLITGTAGGLIVPSPDGQWLAFMGIVDEQGEIHVAPLTGTGAIRLTTTGGASEFSAWQPSPE